MKIDFRRITVEDIEGNPITIDVSKELGNDMYLNAQDIAEADLGHDIYHNGEMELTDEQAAMVAKYVERGFKAFVKKSLLPMLEKKD